ncbi:MAG: lysine--tRNA ligase [Acidimicrobiia bacterium]|nr:lysine--tRNA ligase [Acidimicrobiia bacterium]
MPEPDTSEQSGDALGDEAVSGPIADRIAEVEALRSQGIEPWPVGFRPDHTCAAVTSRFGDLAPETDTGEVVSVAGRIMNLRRMGRLAFARIRDRSGDVQLFMPVQALGEDAFARLGEINVGDYVGATGEVVCTKRGEVSVKPSEVVLLSKALRPLPDKWHGLTDEEARARMRYLDLMVNPDSRRVALGRAAAIAAMRRWFDDHDFVEVETGTLKAIPGGAAAKPFVTHHNALDLDLYLRIALELDLKRLVVGGIERVFEIGRVYRNEGLSRRHNPEFTMLEVYQAYADYRDMMEVTESVVAAAAVAVTGSTTITVSGREMDLGPPWERITMAAAIEAVVGAEIDLHLGVDEIRRRAEAAGVKTHPSWDGGKIMAEVYDELVEPEMWGPVFVCDHPASISPLAKRHRDDPAYAERFEVIVAGRELANAYTEQNDPIVQRRAIEAQLAKREAGDEEAERLDEDFLRALEFGMPPTGGLGIGVDRLVMLLTDSDSIRDVVLFPTYRPEQ